MLLRNLNKFFIEYPPKQLRMEDMGRFVCTLKILRNRNREKKNERREGKRFKDKERGIDRCERQM
jgi:hypothetical protein